MAKTMSTKEKMQQKMSQRKKGKGMPSLKKKKTEEVVEEVIEIENENEDDDDQIVEDNDDDNEDLAPVKKRGPKPGSRRGRKPKATDTSPESKVVAALIEQIKAMPATWELVDQLMAMVRDDYELVEVEED